MQGPDYLQGLAERMSSEHVLSGSRKTTAETVAAAIKLNMSVLLEGPAAVGKTSLVTALAKHMDPPKRLERVNNTETTGLQVSIWRSSLGCMTLGYSTDRLRSCLTGWGVGEEDGGLSEGSVWFV